MLVPLAEAVTETCGGKAGALGALLRAGLPVPDGFVVPFAVYRAAVGDLARRTAREGGRAAARMAVQDHPVTAGVIKALERSLAALGDPHVAVRSSAANEDTREASSAGQYESLLAVHGARSVADAVGACWASLFSSRATAYRARSGDDEPGTGEAAMAVIVQRHIDAEVSGVMFTPARPGDATVIEASWGLGPSVVAGTVTPDTYSVSPDGSLTCSVAQKQTRLDRTGARLLTRDVPVEHRQLPTLDDAAAAGLAALGNTVATVLGDPQDIEWAVTESRTWLLQARPITAAPPPAAPSADTPRSSTVLTGMPGSHGTATGTARTVRGPGDFARVQPGEILICPFTDPAWTPLLRIAAGVVTETGGALSHAAIVAREHHVPAVVGIPNAMTTIPDGTVITVNGTTGTVTTPGA